MEIQLKCKGTLKIKELLTKETGVTQGVLTFNLRLKKDYFNDVQSQVKSSLILILDRSGSMEGSRLDIARELAIRVARAFFSTQNPSITSQNEEALVIIFDDTVIH